MLISAQHKINISPRKILVIQLGDIGDVVWAIPTFQMVKDAFPQANLFVLTRKPNGDLLWNDERIHKVLQITKQSLGNEVRFIRRLRQERFDLTIDLRADDRGAFTSFLSGAPVRVALYYPGHGLRNRLFTHLVDPQPEKKNNLGAAEQSLRVVRGLGIDGKITVPRINVAGESREGMQTLLANEKVDMKKKWISINPFSRWGYKEWGMDKWRNLLISIWEKYQISAIIIGSENERSRAEDLAISCPFPVYNFAGKTTLGEIPALLQMSALHVGVDSAAPHIAAAVGTPTLTIYGPSDWRDWAPPGNKNKVVLPDDDCSPCYQKGCGGKGRSLCLDNLGADKVFSSVEEMLKEQAREVIN